MTLQDVLEHLSYGELSQVAQGYCLDEVFGPQADLIALRTDKDQYAEVAHNIQKMVGHINLGLKQLYSRFFLASRQIIVQQYDHIETYTLHSRYAQTNHLSTEPVKYIMDSVFDPFLDDVLKIEQVFDEDGRGLYLNDKTEPWSLYTPQYNQIQIPYPYRYNIFSVHYRANHRTIRFEVGDDPAEIELDIPEGLLEALLFYVAHRAMASLNVDNNAEGNNYLQKYEQSCQRAKELGLQVTPSYGNHRLDQNGWV